MELSPDEQVCVVLMRKHGVDSNKLAKLLDQSANQAAALIAEYERTGTLPAALAKAFLGGINSGTVAHTNERDQRALQIPALQALVQNRGRGKGQTPNKFIDDRYLGNGNGVRSRLTAIEARKTKAVANLEKVIRVAHDCYPGILEGIAPSVKDTCRQYAEVYDDLDKSVMAKVAAGVQDLKSSAPENGEAKLAQPKCAAYPELSDPGRPEFMIAMLKDALSEKSHLDAFVAEVVSDVKGAVARLAPLKSLERAMSKVFEKHECRFDQLTDLARATIECVDENTLLDAIETLKHALEKGTIQIHLVEHRLDKEFDAVEVGGYRYILLNVTFPPSSHLVELQLNLKAFVDIKNGGGHASYSVGSMLQAFDPAANTHTGLLTTDHIRDVERGLVKKAALVGMEGEGHEMEGMMVKALGSRGVQLVELKLLNMTFSGAMQNLDWLARSAKEIASTLRVLRVETCGVSGPIPPEVGELRRLTVLDLSTNKLEGPVDCSTRCTSCPQFSLRSFLVTGQIPDSLANCTKLEVLCLHHNKLEG
jgi:hypothetical protein